MKDVNDSARLPEEEKEAAVSEDKERNETELETAEVADGAQNEEEQTAEEPAESEDAQTEQIRMETVDPAFQISKRQGTALGSRSRYGFRVRKRQTKNRRKKNPSRFLRTNRSVTGHGVSGRLSPVRWRRLSSLRSAASACIPISTRIFSTVSSWHRSFLCPA